MARYYDLDTWLHVIGVETKEDYQNLYRSVNRRRMTYLYTILGSLVLSVIAGLSGNGTLSTASYFFSFLTACLYPFFYKTYCLCKALEVSDFNAKTSTVLFVLYVLCFFMIVPLVLALIIRATNWGMGLNNWRGGR